MVLLQTASGVTSIYDYQIIRGIKLHIPRACSHPHLIPSVLFCGVCLPFPYEAPNLAVIVSSYGPRVPLYGIIHPLTKQHSVSDEISIWVVTFERYDDSILQLSSRSMNTEMKSH